MHKAIWNNGLRSGYGKFETLQKAQEWIDSLIAKGIFSESEYSIEDVSEQAQLESDIQDAIKSIEHGKRVIALMVVRSKTKSLTNVQSQDLVNVYSTIRALLQDGDLVTARALIDAEPINLPIVTQEDKDALIAEIDKYGQ